MIILLIILVVITATEEHPAVTDAARDPVYPARVFGPSSHVKVGECFEMKCSTFGLKKEGGKVFVYLCKNGVAIEMSQTKCQDSFFLLKSATKEHSGNYSCVFSRTEQKVSEVKGDGENSIFIQVIDRVYPAVIAGETSVRSGADVDFNCTSEDAPDTGLLLAFLWRNQTIVDIEMWNSQQKQASFHLKGVQERDSGNYSCVVSERPLAATELDMCGGNSVFLQVYGLALTSCAMIILLIILVVITATEEDSTVAARDPVHPANIFGPSSHVKVGECFEMKCSTFGFNKEEGKVFVYLCKNGVAIEMSPAKSQDSFFLLKSATKEHTGNYSCVFSRTEQNVSEVKGNGDNSILIQVIDRVYPAVIAGETSVRSGADVDFRCTSEDAPDTGLLLAFLWRNQTIFDIEMWNSQQKQASFHLKGVQERDSGNYSCVISERPLAATELDMCGGNSVFLQVYGEPNEESPPTPSSCIMIGAQFLLIPLLLLALLILLMWKKGTFRRLKSPQSTTEQHCLDLANTGLPAHGRSLEATSEEPAVDRNDTGMCDTQQNLNQGEDMGPSEWSDNSADDSDDYVNDTYQEIG